MPNKDIFYQYKILEEPIDLVLSPLNEGLKFSGNILNFYEKENIEKLDLNVSAKVDHIQSILPDKYNNNSEYLDLILLLKSVKSIYRKCFIFEKIGNIYKMKLSLDKKEWRNDVEISAILILKKDIEENIGYASDKGTQLGWSSTYKIFFDKPEEKSGGESMEIDWESFSGDKLYWLNKHYNKDVYAIDLRGNTKKPKIYLNDDIDIHLKSVLKETSKRLSRKTSSRDLMFKTISTSIFSQLLTDCLIEYKNNLKAEEGSEDDVVIEAAWENLPGWKKELLENYAYKIFPDCIKKDALDNLKESIYKEENKMSEILKIILNIAQNNLGESTQETFTKNAQLLLKKEIK